MNNEFYFILMYTFSKDEVYNRFKESLDKEFKTEQLDQSTYALHSDSLIVGDVKKQISSIIEEIKNAGSPFAKSDFVSLYYAEGLCAQNDSKKDKIIRLCFDLK